MKTEPKCPLFNTPHCPSALPLCCSRLPLYSLSRPPALRCVCPSPIHADLAQLTAPSPCPSDPPCGCLLLSPYCSSTLPLYCPSALSHRPLPFPSLARRLPGALSSAPPPVLNCTPFQLPNRTGRPLGDRYVRLVLRTKHIHHGVSTVLS